MVKRCSSLNRGRRAEAVRQLGRAVNFALDVLGAVGRDLSFFTIREATATQVALNLVLPIAAVALFFLIQAMGLSYTRIGVGAAYLLKRSLGDCWRILLASLPMILIACLIVYLFGRADQVFFSESITVESRAMRWTAVAVHAVQILLLYVLLPLIAIHLWIATRAKAWRRRSRGSNAS